MFVEENTKIANVLKKQLQIKMHKKLITKSEDANEKQNMKDECKPQKDAGQNMNNSVTKSIRIEQLYKKEWIKHLLRIRKQRKPKKPEKLKG